jgi:hypothetical protein
MHEIEMEREQAAIEMLDRLKAVGANGDDLDALAGELGVRKLWNQWHATA